MLVTRKRITKVIPTYSLEGTVMEMWIEYLDTTTTNSLKRNTHISSISTRRNKTLDFIRHDLFSCPLEAKEMALLGIVKTSPGRNWFCLRSL